MTLSELLTRQLVELANAVNYEMTHPVGVPPKPRVSCPTCGSNNSHRLWVNFTDRCTSDWHDNV
jgi:hypothetical protein